MDICINSAGIGTKIPFYKDQTDGTHTWRRTVDVNLIAIIDCTRLAVCFEFSLAFASMLHINKFGCPASRLRHPVFGVHVYFNCLSLACNCNLGLMPMDHKLNSILLISSC